MLYKKPQAHQTLSSYGQATRQTLPREFTVCSWNFQKAGAKAWAKEFRILADVTDIFLAQENRLTPAVLKEIKNSPLCWHEAAGFLSLRGNYLTGVCTGSIVNPSRVIFKQGGKEPFIRIPKMLLATFLPLGNGKNLLVINVHAVNFTRLDTFRRNMAAVAELLLNFEGPVLLGGDFNAWSAKRCQVLRQTVEQAGLSEIAFLPDNRSRFLGKPVDFLFTRQLNLLACGVCATKASDHNPLLARFQIGK